MKIKSEFPTSKAENVSRSCIFEFLGGNFTIFVFNLVTHILFYPRSRRVNVLLRYDRYVDTLPVYL